MITAYIPSLICLSAIFSISLLNRKIIYPLSLLLSLLTVQVSNAATSTPVWIFVSSPDWFNSDIADLSGGTPGVPKAPGWDTHLGLNGISPQMEAVYEFIIGEMAAYDPDFFIVSGDLINGRWFNEETLTMFDPLSRDRLQAIDTAADIYYKWYRWLFNSQGIETIIGAVGDHEIGDDDWPLGSEKAFHLQDMKRAFGRNMVDILDLPLQMNGADSKPYGTPFEEGSYAYQHRNLLIVTVDLFRQSDPYTQLHTIHGSTSVGMEGTHLSWLSTLLDAADQDNDIDHVIIQGHTPVLRPVRMEITSGIMVVNREDSSFWQLLRQHDYQHGGKVRIYFCGEVHAVTASKDPDSDIVQLVHGHPPLYDDLGNYVVFQVHPDRLEAQLRRFPLYVNGNSEYWQPSRPISPGVSAVDASFNAGSLVIDSSAGQTCYSASGDLTLVDQQGLTLHFDFDKTTALGNFSNRGSIGNDSYEGVAKGGVLIVPGMFGSAIQLNGATALVESGRGNITEGESRTVSAWSKTAFTERQTLFSYGADKLANTLNGRFNLQFNDGRVQLNIALDKNCTADGAPQLVDDLWHHVAVVLTDQHNNSCSDIQFYVDGEMFSTNSANADASLTTLPWYNFRIGAGVNNKSVVDFFHGTLDDVAMWGAALTDSKVRALATAGSDPWLHYDASTMELLFDLFDAQQGSVEIANRVWIYTQGLVGSGGDVLHTGNRVTIQLDSFGAGVISVSDQEIFFSDDFSSNTIPDYPVNHFWILGGVGQFQYDAAGKRARILTGDNVGLGISHDIAPANRGRFSLDFLPTRKYPAGGSFILRLTQDENNYYTLVSTDGYEPGSLTKYVNGVAVDKSELQHGYLQDIAYSITVIFSPEGTNVEAFGQSIIINSDISDIVVNSFSVQLAQQDAFLDNFYYEAPPLGNQPPEAVDDMASTSMDTMIVIDVLANDTDPDNNINPTSVTVVNEALNGSTVVETNGTIAYSPDSGFSHEDSFTYTVEDDLGEISNTATVNVTVTLGNQPPEAVNDTASTSMDTQVVIDVLANDIDTDNNIDPASVTVVNEAFNGITVAETNGTITYSPDSSFTGEDSFTYTVKDDNGEVSNPATVNVSVSDQVIFFSDVFSSNTLPDYTVNHFWTQGGVGQFQYDAAGKRARILTGDNVGLGISHDIAPANRGRFSLDFSPTRKYPAGGSFALKLAQNEENYYALVSTDGYEPGSLIKYVDGVAVDRRELTQGYSQGIAYNIAVHFSPEETNVEAFGQSININSDISNIVVHSFSVRLAQQDAYLDTIEYMGAPLGNRPPEAVNDTVFTSMDTTVVIDVVANDMDPDNNIDPFSITIVDDPDNGAVVVEGSGTVTYAPDTGFSGEDSFTYTVDDDKGEISNIATVTISVSEQVLLFSDDFSSNTLPGYTVNHFWTQGGVGQFQYDTAGEQALVLTEDNVGIRISHDIAPSNRASFSLDFLPTSKYPAGGSFILRLSQDENNYYALVSTDGYGPGSLTKYVNGVAVDRREFQHGYSQDVAYSITVNFSPEGTNVEAFEQFISINSDIIDIVVNYFSVQLAQQDAYLDKIYYEGTPFGN